LSPSPRGFIQNSLRAGVAIDGANLNRGTRRQAGCEKKNGEDLQNEFHRLSPINARYSFEKEGKVKNWSKTNAQPASVITPRATSKRQLAYRRRAGVCVVGRAVGREDGKCWIGFYRRVSIFHRKPEDDDIPIAQQELEMS
jgi:hypothetical protein